MKNPKEILCGIHVPLVTPFNEAGELRLDSLAFNVAKLSESSVNGVMALGSNGEFKSLSDSESLSVVRVASQNKGSKKLIVGIGRESVWQTRHFIEAICDQGLIDGVDYFSVITPHYFAGLMDDESLYDYYETIAGISPVPILIYLIPRCANGVTISVSLLNRLANHPNIHGIKDSSPAMMTHYMAGLADREDFAILAGSLNNLLTCLALGGRGGVVSAANYFPDACSELVVKANAHHQVELVADYVQLKNLVDLTGGRRGVASVKACMNLLGFRGGVPRKPVQAVSHKTHHEIEQALRDRGLLE